MIHVHCAIDVCVLSSRWLPNDYDKIDYGFYSLRFCSDKYRKNIETYAFLHPFMLLYLRNRETFLRVDNKHMPHQIFTVYAICFEEVTRERSTVFYVLDRLP